MYCCDMKFKTLSVVVSVFTMFTMASCVDPNAGLAVYSSSTGVNTSVRVLPTGYRTVYVGGSPYFYSRNYWYTRNNGRYHRCVAPRGYTNYRSNSRYVGSGIRYGSSNYSRYPSRNTYSSNYQRNSYSGYHRGGESSRGHYASGDRSGQSSRSSYSQRRAEYVNRSRATLSSRSSHSSSRSTRSGGNTVSSARGSLERAARN